MKVEFLRRVKIEQRVHKPGDRAESRSPHEEDCLRQCVRMGHAIEVDDEAAAPIADGSAKNPETPAEGAEGPKSPKAPKARKRDAE